MAELAALECERIELVDRLGLLLLMLEENDPRYEAVAVRCLGLWLADQPRMRFELAGEAMAGLRDLDQRHGRERLRAVLEAMGEARTAAALVSSA